MAQRMGEAQLMSVRRVGLLAALRHRPGQSFRSLVRASGMAAGTCSHHLRILERHGLAWSIGHGSRRRTFAGPRPADDVAHYMARLASLDAGMESVLAFVRAQPGCIQKAVIAAFPERPHSTVQHILGRLEREGFLTRSPSGRCLRHYATLSPVAVNLHAHAGSGARGAQGVERALARTFPVVPSDAMGSVPTAEVVA